MPKSRKRSKYAFICNIRAIYLWSEQLNSCLNPVWHEHRSHDINMICHKHPSPSDHVKRTNVYNHNSGSCFICVWNFGSLILRYKHRLRVCKNVVLRRIFVSKRDKVTREWNKLHIEELRNLCSSPNTIRQIKSRILSWAGHVARMGKE
jgi:hypothetical protein